MTREESFLITKKIIKEAKCGKEIADAIKLHFNQFQTKRAPSFYEEALEMLNAPLLYDKFR